MHKHAHGCLSNDGLSQEGKELVMGFSSFTAAIMVVAQIRKHFQSSLMSGPIHSSYWGGKVTQCEV